MNTQLATKTAAVLCALMMLAACGPSDKQRAEQAENTRIECLDKLCPGDVEPKRDMATEVALKLNGQWYVGPKEYFSTGVNGASFIWWKQRSISPQMKLPLDVQSLVAAGRGDEFSILIFLRSNATPTEPRGYKLIDMAQAQGWIASRTTLRPGLDVIKMKHVIGPRNQYIDHVTYYVATTLTGVDGLPPVTTCSHDDPHNGGGTGFMWQPGIWAGTRMNQKHCADWPEIYLEIIRVLKLLRKA